MKLISGMHRSGTSLVAQLFFEAGADMGNPSTFYPTDKWNSDGYFEQTDILAINQPLINGLLGRFSYFWLPSTHTVLKRAVRQVEQIRQVDKKYEGKVVKNPHFCLTLPAWLQSGANIEKLLFCLREPDQVAKSIQKRNKTTLKRAYFLWTVHNQRLLEQAKDIPTWFIYYNNLLDKSKMMNELMPAFRFFDMKISEEKMQSLIAKVVKSELNHSPTNIQADYPHSVSELWHDLLERHDRQFENAQAN
jgi:hypothetical protein